MKPLNVFIKNAVLCVVLYYIVAYSCCVSEKVELEAVTQLLLGGGGGRPHYGACPALYKHIAF